eukprot:4749877-Amphidinium_carterae.1
MQIPTYTDSDVFPFPKYVKAGAATVFTCASCHKLCDTIEKRFGGLHMWLAPGMLPPNKVKPTVNLLRKFFHTALMRMSSNEQKLKDMMTNIMGTLGIEVSHRLLPKQDFKAVVKRSVQAFLPCVLCMACIQSCDGARNFILIS